MPCLSSCLPTDTPGVSRSTTKKLGPAGSLRQDRVELRHAAVGDELLGAVEAIVRDRARRVAHRLGARLEGRHVAAGRRFGHPVGDDHPLAGDARQPARLLLRRAAHDDRIGAEADRQERRGHAQIDARHLLRDETDIARAAAESAHRLRQEEQVEPHVGRKQGADELLREGLGLIEGQNPLVGQIALHHLAQRLHHHVAHLGGQSGGRRHQASAPSRFRSEWIQTREGVTRQREPPLAHDDAAPTHLDQAGLAVLDLGLDDQPARAAHLESLFADEPQVRLHDHQAVLDQIGRQRAHGRAAGGILRNAEVGREHPTVHVGVLGLGLAGEHEQVAEAEIGGDGFGFRRAAARCSAPRPASRPARCGSAGRSRSPRTAAR